VGLSEIFINTVDYLLIQYSSGLCQNRFNNIKVDRSSSNAIINEGSISDSNFIKRILVFNLQLLAYFVGRLENIGHPKFCNTSSKALTFFWCHCQVLKIITIWEDFITEVTTL
jgi:hypothetical protein